MPSFDSLGQTVWPPIRNTQDHRQKPGSGLYIVDSVVDFKYTIYRKNLLDAVLQFSISASFVHVCQRRKGAFSSLCVLPKAPLLVAVGFSLS